jgi:hypothetical protein
MWERWTDIGLRSLTHLPEERRTETAVETEDPLLVNNGVEGVEGTAVAVHPRSLLQNGQSPEFSYCTSLKNEPEQIPV